MPIHNQTQPTEEQELIERSRIDLLGVIAELNANPAENAQVNAVMQLFKFWSKTDPIKLKNALAVSSENELRRRGLVIAITGFVQTGDISGAIESWNLLSASDERDFSTILMSRLVASKDVKDVLPWIEGIHPAKERDKVVNAYIDALSALNSGDKIAEAINIINDEKISKKGARAIAGILVRGGQAEIFSSWLDKLSAPLQDEAIGVAAGSPKISVPQADELLKRISSEAVRRRTRQIVVSNICQSEGPAAAAKWVLDIPSQLERAEPLNQLALVWLQQDQSGFSNWAKALPAGELRDGALQTAARLLFTRDSVAARSVAEAIGNEVRRKSFLRELFP